MTQVVKVNQLPTVVKPTEGVHYEVVDGTPQAGDKVRITTTGGAVIFESCYTPPSAPPAPVPVIFDSADWKKYIYRILGTMEVPSGSDDEKKVAGVNRYGAILKAARASTDNMVVAAVDQYDDEDHFRKDEVAFFLKTLNDDGEIVTDAEYAAIIANWPEA